MQLSHNSRAHRTHIGDAPEVPGSGAQGTLHCSTLQDLFIRPLSSKAEDIADFPNT